MDRMASTVASVPTARSARPLPARPAAGRPRTAERARPARLLRAGATVSSAPERDARSAQVRCASPLARSSRGGAPAQGVRMQPAPRPARAADAGPLRLTRRGRLVVTVLVALLLACATVALSRTAAAAFGDAPVATTAVTVAPGDTLWAIAGRVAPGHDRRDVVATIAGLNSLNADAPLQAGEELLVPAAR